MSDIERQTIQATTLRGMFDMHANVSRGPRCWHVPVTATTDTGFGKWEGRKKMIKGIKLTT